MKPKRNLLSGLACVGLMATFLWTGVSPAPAFAAPQNPESTAVPKVKPVQKPLTKMDQWPVLKGVGCSETCKQGDRNEMSCSADGPKAKCTKNGTSDITCTDGTNTTTCNCQTGECTTT